MNVNEVKGTIHKGNLAAEQGGTTLKQVAAETPPQSVSRNSPFTTVDTGTCRPGWTG
uniref:hypothetical protein n=1 Tax=Plantactinospora solaniradicis TaxID=1723736 RepID=UPI00367162E3